MFVYWSPVSMTTSYQLKEIQDLIFMSVEFNKVLFNQKQKESKIDLFFWTYSTERITRILIKILLIYEHIFLFEGILPILID